MHRDYPRCRALRLVTLRCVVGRWTALRCVASRLRALSLYVCFIRESNRADFHWIEYHNYQKFDKKNGIKKEN